MGSVTQMDQWWLASILKLDKSCWEPKIVKSGHGRHYKGAIAVYKEEDDISTTILGIWKPGNRKQVLRKRNSKKKDKKGEFLKRRKEKDRELERQACTNKLILSLPLKVLLSAINKGFSCAPTIQVCFPQSD